MKKDSKELILNVVGEVLSQYINQLQRHKEKAGVDRITGPRYIPNHIKCEEGLKYATRVLANIENIITKESGWTTRELYDVFHDEDFNASNVDWGAQSYDPEVTTKNIITILNSVGIKASEVLTTAFGYALNKFEPSSKVGGDDSVIKFGKLCVNINKISGAKEVNGRTGDHVHEIDFDGIYRHIEEFVNNRAKQAGEDVSTELVESTIFALNKHCYDRAYFIDPKSPAGKYQRNFADFMRLLDGVNFEDYTIM